MSGVSFVFAPVASHQLIWFCTLSFCCCCLHRGKCLRCHGDTLQASDSEGGRAEIYGLVQVIEAKERSVVRNDSHQICLLEWTFLEYTGQVIEDALNVPWCSSSELWRGLKIRSQCPNLHACVVGLSQSQRNVAPGWAKSAVKS